VAASITATTKEVSTTRFTVLSCFKAEFRIDVVPHTAGMMRSVCLERQTEFSEKIRHNIRVGRIVMKRRGGVGDGVNTLDRLVKCIVFGDILDNDEFKVVTVIAEFILEEGAFG
jgi:hypothetical protein